MGDIVFVTGREAGKRLKALVGEASVYVSDVSVAAFINPEVLAGKLKGKVDASLIVIPGTVQGDVSIITEETGIPCVKGPKAIANIPLFLKYAGKKCFQPQNPLKKCFQQKLERKTRNY